MRKRKRKFALELKNGEMVRSIEELREHFDLEKVIGYYKDGRLCEWLEGWFYENEAEAIQKLSDQDENLAEQLCLILGVDSTEQELSSINVEDVARNSDRLNRLRQYTDDPAILRHAPWTAFSQNDLEELLHAEQLPDTICLCPNTYQFSLEMLNKKNIRYIGVGKKVEAVILSEYPIVFESLGISFDNIRLDEAYEMLQESMADEWAEYGDFFYHKGKKSEAFQWFLKAANAGDIDSMVCVGNFYLEGDVIEKNITLGMEWLEKAALSGDGNPKAMMRIAELYDDESFDGHDAKKAMEWYHKAAKAGNGDAMTLLGYIEEDKEKAVEWYLKAAKTGNADAMFNLAILYDDDEYSGKNEDKFFEWLKKAAKAGSEAAQKWLEYGWRK